MKYSKKIQLFNWYVKLITAFQKAEWRRFHDLLFDQVAEGWWFEIYEADFSSKVLYRFPGHFLSFKHCNFIDSNLIGADFFPARFINCDMRGIDLRHANGYVEMINCDLRGAIFDEKTIFNPTKRTEIPSKIINCNLNSDFKQLLKKQGVEVRGEYGKTDIFNRLDTRQEALELRKLMLTRYLKAQLHRKMNSNIKIGRLAYSIAGLLATVTASELPDDDPLMKVLYLAGELELPEEHRGEDATWERFFQLVEKL